MCIKLKFIIMSRLTSPNGTATYREHASRKTHIHTFVAIATNTVATCLE